MTRQELQEVISELEDTIFIADGGEDIRLETETGMKECEIAMNIWKAVKTLRRFRDEFVNPLPR